MRADAIHDVGQSRLDQSCPDLARVDHQVAQPARRRGYLAERKLVAGPRGVLEELATDAALLGP
ncbi:hypothetical protein GCM10010521_35080 [Streptomyces rameus]|uniref:Uncharacterized protein n=1 Tax=Streptomyces rameus TaxID=68261 RepID=A0ABP6NDV2_9ACTN